MTHVEMSSRSRTQSFIFSARHSLTTQQWMEVRCVSSFESGLPLTSRSTFLRPMFAVVPLCASLHLYPPPSGTPLEREPELGPEPELEPRLELLHQEKVVDSAPGLELEVSVFLSAMRRRQ